MTKRPDDSPGMAAARVARLVDVARLSGVSISTAGRVLRGSPLPVAPEVAERVRKAAATLGYVPNILARSLRGAQPKMVGLVVGHMLDPYYGSIAEAVTRHAEARHGMLAIVCNMQRDPVLELKYCRQLWEHRVAGLVLSGGGFDQRQCAAELKALLRDMAAAGVIVTTLVPRDFHAAVFSVDNVEAGRIAAAALVQAGHRHIGLLSGAAQSETARQRLAGSLEVLRDAGARGTVAQARFDADAVGEALRDLLHRQPDITAILAGSDFMGHAARRWLDRYGVPVPQAMSIVAIGGAVPPWAPRSADRAALTAVDIRLDDCSASALDYIAAAGGAPAPSGPCHAPRLAPGQTVAPPP